MTTKQHLRKAGDENVLFIADSENDADLFYATGFLVGDPMIYLELEGKKILLVSDLEFGRAQKEAQVDEVVPTSPIEDALRDAGQTAPHTRIVAEFLKERGVSKVVVSSSLSFLKATKLNEQGVEVECEVVNGGVKVSTLPMVVLKLRPRSKARYSTASAASLAGALLSRSNTKSMPINRPRPRTSPINP